MRRIIVLGLAALLAGVVVEAASAVVPAKKIWSADRQVLIQVPRGALAKNVKITIRVVKRANWPKELKREAEDVEGKVYEFLPHGLRFRKTVTVNFWFRGFAESEGLPHLILARRSGPRRWMPLANETVSRDGARVRVSGTTKRFSNFVVLDAHARIDLVPESVVRAAPPAVDPWDADVVLDFNGRAYSVLDVEWGNTGVVGVPEDENGDWDGDGEVEWGAVYSCTDVGKGTYTAKVVVQDFTWTSVFTHMILVGIGEATGGVRVTFPLSGDATCVAAPSLASLTVSPLEVIGGQSAQGTVTLTAPAPSDVTVALTGGAGVTVPPTVTIPAGATSATFPIGTSEVSDVTHVPITARYSGVSKSELLTLLPPPSCSSGPSVSLTTVSFEGTDYPGVQVTGQCDAFRAAGLHHVRFDPATGDQVNGYFAHSTGCEPAPPSDYLSCEVKPDGRICQIAIVDAEAGDTVRVRLETADGEALQELMPTIPTMPQSPCDWGG